MFMTMDHKDNVDRVESFSQNAGDQVTVYKEKNNELESVDNMFGSLNEEQLRASVAEEFKRRFRALTSRAYHTHSSDFNAAFSSFLNELSANLILGRFELRFTCRQVWLKNFGESVVLTETEDDYLSITRDEAPKRIRLGIHKRVPDGQAFLECVCHRLSPGFVLRSVDRGEPGDILATLGAIPVDGDLRDQHYSHTMMDRLAHLPDPLLETRDGRDAAHIDQMNSIINLFRRMLLDVYKDVLMYRFAEGHEIPPEFQQSGLLGVLKDEGLVKAVAFFSVFAFPAVPEDRRVTDTRGYWAWMMSKGELKREYDDAINAIKTTQQSIGWPILFEPSEDFSFVSF